VGESGGLRPVPAEQIGPLDGGRFQLLSVGQALGMETLAESLSGRVDELIRSHRGQPLLSTTEMQVAIGELIARTEGIEKAVREVALEVEKLVASR
jgi:predicted sugar kinase